MWIVSQFQVFQKYLKYIAIKLLCSVFFFVISRVKWPAPTSPTPAFTHLALYFVDDSNGNGNGNGDGSVNDTDVIWGELSQQILWRQRKHRLRRRYFCSCFRSLFVLIFHWISPLLMLLLLCTREIRLNFGFDVFRFYANIVEINVAVWFIVFYLYAQSL